MKLLLVFEHLRQYLVSNNHLAEVTDAGPSASPKDLAQVWVISGN